MSKPQADEKTLRTNAQTLASLYGLSDNDLQTLMEYFSWWMENKTTYFNTNRAWNKFVEQHVYKTAYDRLQASIAERRMCWVKCVEEIREKVVADHPN
jgi:hypothetical protein